MMNESYWTYLNKYWVMIKNMKNHLHQLHTLLRDNYQCKVLDFVVDFTSVKDYTEEAKIIPPQTSCFVFCNGRGDPCNSLGPIQ